MEQVIFIVLEILSNTRVFQFVSAESMSLTECMEAAFKINSNPELPLITACAPDLSNPTVIH